MVNNLYFEISMFIIRAATSIIKMPCSTTTVFVSLNVRFADSKSLLKLMADPTYCSLQLEHVIKKIALQLSHEKLRLMKNEISLACYCMLQLTIVRLLLMLGLGYWQVQLFTNLYGMNNINDLYSMKRKGY